MRWASACSTTSPSRLPTRSRSCGVERVLVLDWDVHHGNGTEAIFYGSSEVLYSSIHQSPLYPGTGAATDFGSGEGEGYTVNLPVPPGSGPDEFLSLVQAVVAPIAREWRPGLLCISAGYDAHRDDPLANCELDDAAYGDMAATMRDLAAELGVPVLICLEGGYSLGALSRSVVATLEAISGDREPRRLPPSRRPPTGSGWRASGRRSRSPALDRELLLDLVEQSPWGARGPCRGRQASRSRPCARGRRSRGSPGSPRGRARGAPRRSLG